MSADAGNDLTESATDGGAFYDDATLQTAIQANTTAIGTKEDLANKSDDTALGNSTTLYPTQNAVKTYVDAEVSASEQTIVSADAGNDLTESATDGGAFYDDATLQTAIQANTTVIALKEDAANKSNDGTLFDNSATDFPTEQAVKAYVDTQIATVPNFVNTNLTMTTTRTHQIGANNLIFNGAGSVGIDIVPSSKLHVNGDIRAEGAITASGTITTVPDYVFQKYFLGYSDLKKSYNFQTLSQIEAFVKSNYHLPGIQSAEEIKTQGFWDLGQASQLNLEKIEELFLHTIEQEKKIAQLKTENQSLSAELESLRKDMDEIKALLKNKN
ncbi:MAG: bZIP transcription factor [Flavobacteriaceae bacterium]